MSYTESSVLISTTTGTLSLDAAAVTAPSSAAVVREASFIGDAVTGSQTLCITSAGMILFPAVQTVTGTLVVTPPDTQTVAGTVNIAAFPATQTVTGTVIVTPPATQTVAGAITYATLGQSTMAASMPVAIASNQSTFPVTVTFPATQTVTGTVATTFPATQTVTGAVTTTFPATQTVTGTVSISAFPATQTVTYGTLGQTTMASSIPVVLASNQSAGAFPATQTVTGAVTVTFPATQTVTGAITYGTLGQSSMAASVPVVLASNQGPGSFPATQTVTGSVSISALPSPPSAKLLSVVTGVTVVKASAGTFYGYALSAGAAGFLHVYNAVTATAASTSIFGIFPIASGVNVLQYSPRGILTCATGITIGIFTTYNGSTAATTSGSILYS